MTLREEVLSEAVKDYYTHEEKESLDVVLTCLIRYFNSIGRADAANVLRNLKNRHLGIQVRYMNKMADMIKQYKEV